MAKYLSREEILSVDDIHTEEVEVPEWGGVVLVRGLNGAERDRLETSTIRQNGKNMTLNLENMRAKLVAMCIVDENGKRIFNDADVRDLGKKSGQALDRVYAVAQRLSGLSNADVEELSKNLLQTLGEDSTSG